MLYNGCLNDVNVCCEVLELENWMLDDLYMVAESFSFGLWNGNCVLDVGMCCIYVIDDFEMDWCW